MSIIDCTFFEKGTLHIEGLGDGCSIAAQATGGELAAFVVMYEHEYLENVLGEELAEELLRYIDDGDGRDESLDGLIEMLRAFNGSENVSPIANYVYFHYVRLNNLHATASGTAENNSDNRIVKSDGLVIRAWNDMVKMNRKVLQYLRANMRGRFRFNVDMLETINPLGV